MTTPYDKRFVALRYYLYGRSYFTGMKAFNYGQKHHKGMRFDKVTPEFQHQVDIALYLTTLKDISDEETTLAVALLHDVVEDYNVLRDFTTVFDEDITNSVWRLTKPGSKGRSNEPLTPENKKMYFDKIAEDPIASLVKGADRINNIQTMAGAFSKEKQKRYSDEVEQFFLPMIKTAMKNFPEQTPAYLNITNMLRCQLEFVKQTLVVPEVK
jgi:(p)ppGpp synthase/HD superfamily hydrolase